VDSYKYARLQAVSAYDIRHNFVASYRYELPLDRLVGTSPLTTGWTISGVTRFSTGLPVTLFSFGDDSLINTQNQGVTGVGSDLPYYTPSCNLNLNCGANAVDGNINSATSGSIVNAAPPRICPVAMKVWF
jgi:hypothetical protein